MKKIPSLKQTLCFAGKMSCEPKKLRLTEIHFVVKYAPFSWYLTGNKKFVELPLQNLFTKLRK